MHATRQLPISDRFMHLMESAARATEQGTPELADKLYDQAAQEHPEVFIGLAGSFKTDGNFNEAFKFSMMALKHAKKPATKACCWNNAGMLLAGIGENEKAEECFLEGLKIDKRQQDLLCNYALCLKWKNQIPEALKVINRALANNPVNYQAQFSKAMMQLASGDFLEGFKNYEARFKNPNGRVEKLQTDKPEWEGQCDEGKRVLVYCEQGAGDTIMMARYAELIAFRKCLPMLRCQKGLKRLFRRGYNWVKVVEEGDPLPEFDYCIPAMSLPRIFRTNLERVFGQTYLYPEGSKRLVGPWCWKVGICWAGSIDHTHDKFRSTELSQWAEILAVPGIKFYSLQVGIRSMDLIGSELPITDLSPEINDYADTANAIAGLDLVISVDTSVVHLAGAMGKECWVLLPFAADWRWMLDRTDSPWYPSLRLCRQRAPREWEPLIASVAQLLRAKYQEVTAQRV